ncbi:hypothetical protein Maeo_0875 [Methanococcus aeolicus Nankai-3]|uniref:Uncharacterized protein n=3 Tax=Methanococcus aeolicus TaxID=42879 RepID=A6UVD5_META3|nr:hypothetical protein [Methanococcus aeolicus]ABR56457.1 hypothetical protein Maeo_0875 [Methanococcus aeolicus Nankai-3]
MNPWKVILYIIIIGAISYTMFNHGMDSPQEIVENSPYPEFMFVDSNATSIVISHNSGKHFSPYIFYGIDGIYSNIHSPNEIAIKTPFWFLAYLTPYQMNMTTGNGCIYINSGYVGKPDTKWVEYMSDSNAIAYTNDRVICMSSEGKYTKMDIIFQNYGDINIDANTLNLKDVKVIQSNIENKGDVAIVHLTLDAPLEKFISKN